MRGTKHKIISGRKLFNLAASFEYKHGYFTIMEKRLMYLEYARLSWSLSNFLFVKFYVL